MKDQLTKQNEYNRLARKIIKESLNRAEYWASGGFPKIFQQLEGEEVFEVNKEVMGMIKAINTEFNL